MGRLNRLAVVIFSACFVVWAAVASAQTNAAKQGPLVLQPVTEGPVIVPEVKWANFNSGKGGVLVGGFGGWQMDNGLLLGAGVDFLANHNHGDPVSGMGYGGFVGGWSMPGDRAIRPGVRALVGYGDATLTDSISFAFPTHLMPIFGDHHDGDTRDTNAVLVQQARFSEGFFIFEPQASVAVRLGQRVGLDVAGGYRVIGGANRFGNNYDSRLRGASVSVGARIGV